MQKLKPIEKSFSIYLGTTGSGRTTGCILEIIRYIQECKKRKLNWRVVVVTIEMEFYNYQKNFPKGVVKILSDNKQASDYKNKIVLINSINQSVQSIDAKIDFCNLKEALLVYDTASITPVSFIQSKVAAFKKYNVGIIAVASNVNEIHPLIYNNLDYVKWFKRFHATPDKNLIRIGKFPGNVELFELAHYCLFTSPTPLIFIDVKNDCILSDDYDFYTGCINYAESQLKKYDHEGILFMAQKLANLSRYAISKGNK